MVLPHGVLVALSGHQNPSPWRMFGFGFGTVFIVTQMHGLGLDWWTRGCFFAIYVVAVILSYYSSGYTTTS